MSQFIFVSSEGRFPIPDGESRMGSDSSCAICVHGEGVMPEHAYLKSEKDKVTIRPFNERAAVMVGSNPVTGPHQLGSGDIVSVGPVQLRLVSKRVRWRFPWRVFTYLAGGLAAIVVVLVLLRFLWFNEGWWKEQILTAVEQAVGRENAEIEDLDLHLLDGRILVHNLTIANREPFPGSTDLLEVPEAEISIDVWRFLRSQFREVRSARLTLKNPVLKVERIARDDRPLSNVDDLFSNLSRYASDGLRTLAALEGEVLVDGGRVEFKDRFADKESALTDVSLRITQQGFEQKLAVEMQARPETESENSNQTASISLSGDVRLFDAAGRINPNAIGDGKFILRLQSFDLARLCQHMRWAWRVRSGHQKIVPGKPVTGELKISFSDLARCDVTGTVESESLVSLLEPDRPPLGNIPTVVEVDRLTYDFEKGWPTDLEINLRADRTLAAARSHADASALVMQASLRRNATGEERFEVELRSRLQDLCATDVGERLQLKGRLEGGLKASISFVRETENDAATTGQGPQTAINGTVELDRSAQVLVPSPLPGGQARWQNLNLTAELNAVAGSTPEGVLSDIKGSIKAESDSFSVESTEDTELNSLDRPDQFSLKTDLKVKLEGREFWNQYGPVLSLFGLDRPVEESMTLDVMALSTTVPSGPRAGTRQVKIGCEGYASRQWAKDPAKASLRFILYYYPETYAAALMRASQPGDQPGDPYLVLNLGTGTEKQQPYAHVKDAEVTRFGGKEIIKIPSIVIQSDMKAFEERFRPYLKWACDYLGTDVLSRYRLSGLLRTEGGLTITRPVKRFVVGAKPFEADFRFGVRGRELSLSGPCFTQKTDDTEPATWTWSETREPEVTIKGKYVFQPAPNREEPDVRRFDEFSVEMEGDLGKFKLTSKELDLYLLERLATRTRVPGKAWPDAAGELAINGKVEPAAFDLLRRLKLPGLKSWLTDPLVSGTLRLNVTFNRREDVAHLKELVYQQANVQNAFWLRDIDLVARLRGVRTLTHEIFGRTAGTPLEPVRLLQHLSEGLVVRRLIFDAKAFASWLSHRPPKKVRENSFADFVPTGLASLLSTRTLDPQEPWSVTDLGLEAIPNQEQSWRVYGRFATDFLLTLPPEFSLSRSSLAPVLMFKGPWVLPEKDAASLTLEPDGQYMYISLRSDLDATDLSLRNLYPAWVYIKDSDKPLKLNIKGLFPLRSTGTSQSLSFETLALTGSTLALRLQHCQAHVATEAKGKVIESFTLRNGTLRGGPLFQDCHVQDLSYSRKEDQLMGRMTVRGLDVPVLARVLPRYPGWSYEGRVAEMALDVRSKMSSLLALEPDAKRDRLRADLRCENVLITANAGQGERAVMEFNGEVGVTPSQITGSDLQIILLHYKRSAGAPLTIPAKYAVQIPKLSIETYQPGQNLRQAFAKQPYPIQVNLPLNFKTAVDIDRLAEAWQTLRKVHYKGRLPKPRKPSANPFDVLRALRADGSLQTPSLKFGPWVLDGLAIQQYGLRDLKLNVPLCAVKCGGGDLILSTAFYDLNHPQVSHSQKFQLTEANLKSLLGLGAEDYQVSGNVTIKGELQGIGPTPGASWEGTAKVHLLGATGIEPPAAFKLDDKTPANAPFVLQLPPLVRAASKKVSERQDLPASELREGMPETSEAAAPWNSLFTALSTTLAGFALPAQRLAFEPAQLETIISHGIAELRPVRFIGRGPAEGLELWASGRVNLSDGSITEPLVIYPKQLPPAALKRLRLSDWSLAEQEAFMEDLRNASQLALRLTGTWKKAVVSIPLGDIRRRVRSAMPPPTPPPPPVPKRGQEPVKPKPPPEEDPSLSTGESLFLIFDRLSKQPKPSTEPTQPPVKRR